MKSTRNTFHVLFVVVILFNPQKCFTKKQGYNPTSDFLFHESGGLNNRQKYTNLDSESSTSPATTFHKQLLDVRDDVAQFPPLSSQTTRSKNNSAKRDYVAPHLNPLKSAQTTQTSTAPTIRPLQNSGKRDYVNPQFPSNNNNVQSVHTGTTAVTQSTLNHSSLNSGKQDYMNQQFPPLKTDKSHQSMGAVKDLINFYDNKNTGQRRPQEGLSYSSILKSGDNKPGSIQSQSVPQMPNVQPTKPATVSSTIDGSTKLYGSGIRHQNTNNNQGGLLLPSKLLNSNKNTDNRGSSNIIGDNELQTISEELLRKDTNNAAKLISINYQEKTTSQSKDDKAPLPLLTVPAEVWNIPTIQKFVPLLDNYERDTLVNEYVTPQERNEENAFMDAIMSTTVIRHLMNFLKDKGYVTADTRQQRDYLKQLWFTLYSRGKGKISSSGFEHVFVSELKNGEVSGLHNWIYFSKEESANRLNYLGYLKYLQINDKGAVMKVHFNQQGADKPVDSLFIGTSPELEMSLYTLCFVVRADGDCKLKLAGKDVSIVTHTFRYRSKNYIGSAYAQI